MNQKYSPNEKYYMTISLLWHSFTKIELKTSYLWWWYFQSKSIALIEKIKYSLILVNGHKYFMCTKADSKYSPKQTYRRVWLRKNSRNSLLNWALKFIANNFYWLKIFWYFELLGLCWIIKTIWMSLSILKLISYK